MNRFFLAAILFCAPAFAEDAQPLRTWVDATGEHRMEASYVKLSGSKVTLKNPDGEEFEIELTQLSAADLKYVASLGPNIPPGSLSDSDQPMVIGTSADRGDAVEVRPDTEEWTFTPHSVSRLDFRPKQFTVRLREFAERPEALVVTPSGRFAALTTQFSGNATRVSVLDLSRGRVIASEQAEGEFKAIAISDDGRRVAIRSTDFHASQEIGVFQIASKGLKPVGKLSAFVDWAEPEVKWAQFVGEDQIAVLCNSGGISGVSGVSIWNLSTFQEDMYFELEGEAAAAKNADGSVIAFVDKNSVGLFRISDRKFLGLHPVPEGLWARHLAFSPSEQRLTAFAVNRLVAWDTATGAVSRDVPDLKLPGDRIECVQEDYVLLGGKFLVDVENQLKLWTYQGMHQTDSARGTTFFAIRRGAGRSSKCAIVPVSLPDPDAEQALTSALAQPDTFLLKPGGTVQLDVSGVPEPHRETVRDYLTSQLAENRVTVAGSAVSTLVASIAGPTGTTAVYYSREDRIPHKYSFTILTSKLELVHNGDAFWSRQNTNQPSSVYTKEGVSPQEAIQEKTKEPNLFFFEHAHLPKLVQKEQEKEGPGLLWTLGESQVR